MLAIFNPTKICKPADAVDIANNADPNRNLHEILHRLTEGIFFQPEVPEIDDWKPEVVDYDVVQSYNTQGVSFFTNFGWVKKATYRGVVNSDHEFSARTRT